MFRNYGDRNFLQYGCLVDDEHEENEVRVLYCRPFDEPNGYTGEWEYLFADCTVCVEDDWIDRKAVMDYIGMTYESYDEIRYAIGCIEYYGVENFADSFSTNILTAGGVKRELDYYLIAWDNLVVEED